MRKFFFLILFSLFQLCAEGQEYETGSYGSENFPIHSFDTTNYSSIPVISKLKDCFGDPYVFNFKIDKIRFRVVHLKSNSFPQSAKIQRLYLNKWEDILEFYEGPKLGSFKFKDVNNDGFIDIVRDMYFDSEVYLFKPAINNFIDSVCGILNYNIVLLDTIKNIYCDFQELRQNCGNISSTLYTFKNYSKYNLFYLELRNCNGYDNHKKIHELVLSKCIDGSLDNLKKIKKYKLQKSIPINAAKYFNNKEYWKKKYKQLLGYS